MGVKYSAAELNDASRKVMKSLNNYNKPIKTLSKPAIKNSLGEAEARVSKSARKRQNRKKRANVGGSTMETLLDTLPKIEDMEPIPVTHEEKKMAEIKHAVKKSHTSRKAEQKVARHEIENFGIKSLEEIKQNLFKMRQTE